MVCLDYGVDVGLVEYVGWCVVVFGWYDYEWCFVVLFVCEL